MKDDIYYYTLRADEDKSCLACRDAAVVIMLEKGILLYAKDCGPHIYIYLHDTLRLPWIMEVLLSNSNY
jgi:hypothetical protein